MFGLWLSQNWFYIVAVLFLLLIWFNVRHLRVNFDDYFDWCLRNFGDTKEKNSKDDEKKD